MSESVAAASYWANRKLGAFSSPRPWSARLASVIAEHSEPADAADVLEFGCNVGRHLQAIAQLMPRAQLTGIDLHLPAVQQARADGLHVLLGDEMTLELFGPSAFDVAFTVSVIDHLPKPQPALDALDRAAEVLILLEPWLGHEAKLTDTGTSPWTYSWDYAARLSHRQWQVTEFPLHDHGAGPHYRLHIGR